MDTPLRGLLHSGFWLSPANWGERGAVKAGSGRKREESGTHSPLSLSLPSSSGHWYDLLLKIAAPNGCPHPSPTTASSPGYRDFSVHWSSVLLAHPVMLLHPFWSLCICGTFVNYPFMRLSSVTPLEDAICFLQWPRPALCVTDVFSCHINAFHSLFSNWKVNYKIKTRPTAGCTLHN